MKRIGIAGAAGSGKTTAAEYLQKEYGFKIHGFATPLYKLGEIHSNTPSIEWHSRVWGWCNDHLEPLGYTSSERWWFTYKTLDIMDETPIVKGKNRTLLQFIGTEVGRGLDENLWTNIFEQKVEDMSDRIVNDNLRFSNEFDSLERLGFITVFISTPIEIRAERYEKEYGKPMSKEQLAHSSEAQLDDIRSRCDMVYTNVGTKADLCNLFDTIVKDATLPQNLEVKI